MIGCKKQNRGIGGKFREYKDQKKFLMEREQTRVLRKLKNAQKHISKKSVVAVS